MERQGTLARSRTWIGGDNWVEQDGVIEVQCAACQGRGHFWDRPEQTCSTCRGRKVMLTEPVKLALMMLRVLDVLDDKPSMTANEVAHRLKVPHAAFSQRGRGRQVGDAVRVTPALTGLVNRRLVRRVERRDGLSGGAFEISNVGVRALQLAKGVSRGEEA